MDRTSQGTTHDLLLALAGRVDDDLLSWARELVALGEEARALDLLTASLYAAREPLPPSVRDGLMAAADAARAEFGGTVRLSDGFEDSGTAHGFAAPGGADPVANALLQVPDRSLAGCRVLLAHRLTPAGTAPGPLPHAVVIIQMPHGTRPADVVAYQVAAALDRAGAPASVEVLVEGAPVPGYHAAALGHAVVVREDAPDAGAWPPVQSRSSLDEPPQQRSAEPAGRRALRSAPVQDEAPAQRHPFAPPPAEDAPGRPERGADDGLFQAHTPPRGEERTFGPRGSRFEEEQPPPRQWPQQRADYGPESATRMRPRERDAPPPQDQPRGDYERNGYEQADRGYEQDRPNYGYAGQGGYAYDQNGYEQNGYGRDSHGQDAVEEPVEAHAPVPEYHEPAPEPQDERYDQRQDDYYDDHGPEEPEDRHPLAPPRPMSPRPMPNSGGGGRPQVTPISRAPIPTPIRKDGHAPAQPRPIFDSRQGRGIDDEHESGSPNGSSWPQQQQPQQQHPSAPRFEQMSEHPLAAPREQREPAGDDRWAQDWRSGSWAVGAHPSDAGQDNAEDDREPMEVIEGELVDDGQEDEQAANGRLSDADRQLLARLQAEMTEDRRPRFARRPGIRKGPRR